MIKRTSAIILILYCNLFFGQEDRDTINNSNWKKILVYHDFKVTKNKNNIPSKVLKIIDIDTISEIANPREKWNSSCVGSKNVPTVKLNWAAFINDKSAWVISLTSGGYSASTKYYLVVSGDEDSELEVIRNSGRKGENFKNFKTKYLAGTLKKGALF